MEKSSLPTCGDGDVDLWVEGLRPGDVIEATVAAQRVFSQSGLSKIDVDLVPASMARPLARGRVEEEGVCLHE